MARVAFDNKPVGNSKNIKSTDFPITKFTDENHNARITDKTFESKRIKSKDYSIAKFDNVNYGVRLTQVLPFRVKFTTIGIEGYGPGNVPPIGIAVIGINNYIL
jgi:hypothetical protein